MRNVLGLAITTFAVCCVIGSTSSRPAGSGASENAELTRASAVLAAIRDEITATERQLARVQGLEQTIAVMTPLLADRSRALTGDVNGDGKRDRLDLSTIYCCKGCPATQPSGPAWFCDLDRDGDVDDADVRIENGLIK